MVWTTVLFGVLLVVLGGVGYFVAEPRFWPVAVPGALGLALIVAGLLGLKQSFRKNAMHAAVLVAVLGLVGTGRSLKELIERVLDKPGLIIESVAAILCGVFVWLALKSFLEARRQPAQAGPALAETAAESANEAPAGGASSATE